MTQRDWTMITIMLPPASMLPRYIAAYLKEVGFVFDEELMGVTHPDGSVAEWTPCDPHWIREA